MSVHLAFSVSSELFLLCLAALTRFNNPFLRGHRPHLPELIGVSAACESLLQLALNLREVSAEAVLESVVLVDFDLLAGWAFVIHRAVEIAAALLLLVYALYAHFNGDGTVYVKRNSSVNATAGDCQDC